MDPEHPFEFRRARPADKAALWAICDKIWGGHDPLKAALDVWLADLPDRLFLVAEYQGRMVGCFGGRWLTPSEGWMSGLRKDPAAPGGLGRAATREIMRAMTAIRPVRQFRASTSTDQRMQMHLMPLLGFELIARRTLWLRAPGPVATPASDVRVGDWPGWQARPDRIAALPRLLNLEWDVYDTTPETLRGRFVDCGGWLHLGPVEAPTAEALVWRDPRYHTVSGFTGADEAARSRLLAHIEAEASAAGVPVAFFLDGPADGLADALAGRGYRIWKAPDAFLLYESPPPAG